MAVNLKALIAKTEAALASETDPGQLRVLEAKLGTFLARAEMGDDDGDDDKKKKKGDDDDDDGDEESKAAKHAARAVKLKAKAKATELRSKAAELKGKAAEHEEEAKKCEEEASDGDEGKKEESAALSGMTAGAAAALASSAGLMPDALRRIDALEKDARNRQRKAMIEGARAERKITPAEYRDLVDKPIAFVKEFLSMRPHAIVNVDDSALEIPDVSTTAGDVPASVKSMVEAAVQTLGLKGEKADQHREKQYAAFRAGAAGKAVTH